MIRASDLFHDLHLPAEVGAHPVTALADHTKDIIPGAVFFAVSGTQDEGMRYLQEAVAKGALFAIAEKGTPLHLSSPLPLFFVPHVRAYLAEVAGRFYGPSPECLVAVTGTNGKTSTVEFTRRIWAHMGLKSASIGTLGVQTQDGDMRSDSGSWLTTPGPIRLRQNLADLKTQGVTHVAFEASSHALVQSRFHGLSLAAAAWTNLTPDHLDYHGTLESYQAAKMQLLSQYLTPETPAILWHQLECFEDAKAICQKHHIPVWTYGGADSTLALLSRKYLPRGQHVQLRILDETLPPLTIPLVGTFQLDNLLCALGLVLASTPATRANIPDIVAKLAHMSSIPGRLEYVGASKLGGHIYVDHAHTYSGVVSALEALRAHTAGRIGIVFGAGGDRPRERREGMGRAAHALSDFQIVTNDNPRHEDPALIRKAILAACPSAQEIPDRESAIAAGIAMLEPGDVLLIAGKGHQTGEIIGDVVHPFDDAAVARAHLSERRAG